MKKIHFTLIQETLFLTTDIDEFNKSYDTNHSIKDIYGAQNGNGIYISPENPDDELIYTIMHEVNHYIDFMFLHQFRVEKNIEELSEIRTRLHQEITRKVYKEVKKLLQK